MITSSQPIGQSKHRVCRPRHLLISAKTRCEAYRHTDTTSVSAVKNSNEAYLTHIVSVSHGMRTGDVAEFPRRLEGLLVLERQTAGSCRFCPPVRPHRRGPRREPIYLWRRSDPNPTPARRLTSDSAFRNRGHMPCFCFCHLTSECYRRIRFEMSNSSKAQDSLLA